MNDPGDALLVELGACALAFGDGELPFDRETAALVPATLGLVARARPGRSDRGARTGRGRATRRLARRGSTATSTTSTSPHSRCATPCTRLGLPEERLRFELFDGGHRGLSHRYPLSLAYVIDSLSITF